MNLFLYIKTLFKRKLVNCEVKEMESGLISKKKFEVLLSKDQIEKVNKCIDLVCFVINSNQNPQLDTKYNIEDCHDLASLWNKKGLKGPVHFHTSSGGFTSPGFSEEIRIKMIAEWYKILKGNEIPKEFLEVTYYKNRNIFRDITYDLIDQVNFNLMDIEV